MFNLIDDELLEEANPYKKPKLKEKRPRSYWVQFALCAACFLLVLNMSILTPILIAKNTGDNEQGNTNQIQNVIVNNNFSNIIFESLSGQKTEVLLSSPLSVFPKEYNSFITMLKDKYPSLDSSNRWDDTIDDEIDESGKDEIVQDKNESTGNKYEETTDLQTQGVIEGDLIKRSSTHIYYLDGNILKVYTIDKNKSTLVTLYNMDKIYEALNEGIKIKQSGAYVANEILDEETKDEDYYPIANEMFLSQDLKTITVVASGRFDFDDGVAHYINELPYVSLISLNIEDLGDIYVNNIATVYGRYESARIVDGEILLFTKHNPRRENAIIPQYSDGEGFELFGLNKIYTPKNINSKTYLLAHRMDQKTLKMNDVGAYLDFGDIVYVANDNIYLTREYYQRGDKEHKTVTEILRIDYSGDKFVTKGTLKVDGYLNNRFSLDEYDGVLRVVTTDNTENKLNYIDEGTSANLYCALVNTMEIRASVMRFAPEGETVRSVRFKHYTAYVCTSYQTTDPVFVFDLGNLDNIYYKDTGTIPGFSNTLIDFDDDLLGIGVDENWNLKLEVYRQNEQNVDRVCHYIVNGTCSDEYKAYFIDRERGLIGLGVYDRNASWPNRYLLLHYTGSEFRVLMNKEVNGNRDVMRATLVDGWFYIVSNNDFVVNKIS